MPKTLTVTNNAGRTVVYNTDRIVKAVADKGKLPGTVDIQITLDAGPQMLIEVWDGVPPSAWFEIQKAMES